MPAIRIRDLDGSGLAFDLTELLQVLGSDVLSSHWHCVVEQFVPTDGARPSLGDEYESPSGVVGSALVGLAAETRQIIDGRFDAFRPGRKSRGFASRRSTVPSGRSPRRTLATSPSFGTGLEMLRICEGAV